MEAASGQPFLTSTLRRIFDPLGIPDIVPDSSALGAGEDYPVVNLIRELIYDPQARRGPALADRAPHGRVTQYCTRFASDPKYGVHVMRPLDYSCYAGAGVFLSTPSDLVRFGSPFATASCCNPPSWR